MEQKKIKDNKNLIILAVILCFALAIRIDYINHNRDFWHDEAFQYLYSEEPVSYIIDSNDVHPPLFNILAKVFSWGGVSAWSLRFCMVILSMGFLFGIYLLCETFFSPKVGLYSVFVLSFLPTFIHYSTEFRSYIFVLMILPIQILAFNKMILKKDWKIESIYLATSLIMLYSHYFIALVILVQLIYAMGFSKHTRDTYFIYVLMAIASLPLFAHGWNTLPKIHSFWFDKIDLISLLSTYSYLLTPPQTNSIIFFTWFYTILIVGIVYLFKKKEFNRYHLQLLLYGIIPVLLLWALSQATPIYHHRYFLFGGSMLVVLFAIVLERFDDMSKNKDLGMFFISILLIILAIGGYYDFVADQNYEIGKSYDALIEDIDDQIFVVVHTSPFSQSPYKFYSDQSKVRMDNLLLTNLTEKQRFTAGGSVIKDEEIISKDYLQNNITMYAVSNSMIFKHLIFSEGGIYVTKNRPKKQKTISKYEGIGCNLSTLECS